MRLSDLMRAIEPISRRVMLMVSRGVWMGTTDGQGLQTGQVAMLAGETRDAVERVQPFGLTSAPVAGADVLVLCMGGNRDHPVVVGVDDRRYRPSGMQPGEVCLYSAYEGGVGHRILLKADRSIEISGDVLVLKADTKVRVEAPMLECTGQVKDLCDGAGMTMEGMRTDYNAHGHPGGSPPTPLMQP